MEVVTSRKKLGFRKTWIMRRTSVVLSCFGLFLVTLCWGQEDPSARLSPAATATGVVNGATITIEYSSPAVRDRKIFGELVPFGVVWRAGANEATLFTTDRDITVQGKTLPAGQYSLYAIPGQREWSIIFNKQTGQWGVLRGGATSRDPAHDQLVVKVKPRKSPFTEDLTYEVNSKGFVIRWERVRVPVLVK